jgi:uncharacterized protein with HEPN domain
MSKSHLELLHHISDEIDFLLSESLTINKDAFLKDEKAKRAYARSFEIIGDVSCGRMEINGKNERSSYSPLFWR